MRKILFILLMFTSLFFLPQKALAADKITIYLFRGDTCSHCEQALDYINENRDLIPDNVEIVTYEVWENEENAKLMDKVADILEVDKNDNYGTPFFVVGDSYNKGYRSGEWQELFTIANKYQEENNYEDVVAQVIKEEKLEVDTKTLNDLYKEPSKVVTIIVYSVFGIIVLGFIAMIVFSRK